MIRLNTRIIHAAMLAAISSSLLSACAGGGGGASKTLSGQNDALIEDDEPTGPWKNSLQTTITTGANSEPVQVLVGVIDDGFNSGNSEIAEKISGSKIFGPTLSPFISHGTNVAQVLAGKNVGYSGNARLLLAAAGDATGRIDGDAVNTGGAWAINNGARVVNLSLSHSLDIADTPAMFDAAVAKKSVLVFSAGNSSENFIPAGEPVPTVFAPGNESAKNLVLLVGALGTDNKKASYSNFAGDNLQVQSRFLVALGLNRVEPVWAGGEPVQFEGTSSATPVVSAAATTLFALWPHLTGVEISSRLLETADQSFSSLYQQNNCGTAQNVNCGKYTFGQGRLDLKKAMEPKGTVMLPLGLTVNSAGNAVTQTSLQLPLAFGDALKGKTLNAVVFDDYGRDYVFDLTKRMGSQQSRLNLFGADKQDEFMNSNGPLDMSMRLDSKNAIGRLAMSYASGPASFKLDHGLTSEAQAANFGFGLARNTSDAAKQSMTTGVGMSLNATAKTSFDMRSAMGSAFGATRNELAMTVRPADGTALTIGQSASAEKALLGAAGEGGLAVDSSAASGTFVRMSQDLGNGWKAFGHAEMGSMAVKGNNTLTAFSDVRTTQFGLGLAMKTDKSTLGFAVSQPLRADRATAHFNVATGRTLDGQVQYTSRTLTLTPTGRQMDLDVSFKQALTQTSSFAVQGTYTMDAGHVAGARDYGVMAKYRIGF